MSVWKEVKYALNSTLGTDDFKSLDNVVNQSKSLCASNDLYYIFISQKEQDKKSFDGETKICEFLSYRNGTSRIRATIYTTAGSTWVFTVKLYKKYNAPDTSYEQYRYIFRYRYIVNNYNIIYNIFYNLF